MEHGQWSTSRAVETRETVRHSFLRHACVMWAVGGGRGCGDGDASVVDAGEHRYRFWRPQGLSRAHPPPRLYRLPHRIASDHSLTVETTCVTVRPSHSVAVVPPALPSLTHSTAPDPHPIALIKHSPHPWPSPPFHQHRFMPISSSNHRTSILNPNPPTLTTNIPPKTISASYHTPSSPTPIRFL